MAKKPSTTVSPVSEEELGDVNAALIIGTLVAEPEPRELPSGSVAFSFSLTVRSEGSKTTSVPLVWYDPPKRIARLTAGAGVVARGAVVRRFFRSGGGLGSSTEVVVSDAAPAGTVAAQRVVAAAVERAAGMAA